MGISAKHLSIALVSLLAGCKSGSPATDAGGGNDAATDVGGDLGGSDGGPTLTCAWLEGDNCWKTTGRMATGCLPPETETGVLSADGATCTYASGIRVTFTPPLVLPPPGDVSWNFTVTGANSQACLHFEEAALGMKLVVMGQTVDETSSGLDLTIACPGGTSYTTPNAFDLLACEMGLDGVPGIAWASSNTALSMTLLGVSAEALPLFDCRRP